MKQGMRDKFRTPLLTVNRRLARQVVEMNIVRGRGAWRERTRRRERAMVGSPLLNLCGCREGARDTRWNKERDTKGREGAEKTEKKKRARAKER